MSPPRRWRTVPGPVRISPDVLEELLGGGQAFRWQRLPDGSWDGVWGWRRALLRAGSRGLEWKSDSDTGSALSDYVGGGRNWDEAVDCLPWRSDPHLARCLREFPGLRILRQPLEETLLCFLCSPTKKISQISRLVESLAGQWGAPIGNNNPFTVRRNQLPSWERLAGVPEADLRSIGLGFRARNIAAAARFLAARPRGWLRQAGALPFPEARSALLEIPGVGEKVADCVLLFGADKLEAFPVDVWMIKAMERHYGLTGWPPSRIAHFGRVHFGPCAGLAQQYLFAWERRRGRSGANLNLLRPEA